MPYLLGDAARSAGATTGPPIVGDLGIDFTDLINQTGTTYTDLRPSGKATIGDQRLNVVTEGSFIEKDNSVKVIAVEGNRVVVRKT